MTPSKEAIEASWQIFWKEGSLPALEAAYAIDVSPLEQKVKELEAELNLVDMSLARRERLDDCPDRYSKIEKMCSENGRLKAENQRLGEQLAHFKDCYASLASLYDKAQLERGGGDVE